MDIPHISPLPIEKKEIFNNNHNDDMTLGINRKFTTNKNAIAPRHQPEKEILIHPYKLFNFTNEYTKDISNLFDDPCLSPNYSASHNFKDKKFRGNQFGVRYSRNKIFNRPRHNMKYHNTRLLAQYPLLVKNDPWFAYNWQGNQVNQSLALTNNRQDIYDNEFTSHPYFYYRDQTNPDTCEKPIVQIPHFLEGFANNCSVRSWLILLLIPLLIIILIQNLKLTL